MKILIYLHFFEAKKVAFFHHFTDFSKEPYYRLEHFLNLPARKQREYFYEFQRFW